jgi:hypothetical protein
MRSVLPDTPQKKWISLTAVFLIVGVCIWLKLTKNGLGSTVDAQAYLYAAQTLSEEGSLRTPYGFYTNWTPLFPLILSVLGARLSQFLAFFCNVILLSLVVYHYFPKVSFFKNVCFFHVFIHTAFWMTHFFVWSEAWFMVFLWLCLLCLTKINHTKYFVMLLIASNFLCLERMAGIFFVGAFTIVVFQTEGFRKAFLYAFFATWGLAAWFIRNMFIQNKPDFVDNIWMVSWKESAQGYSDTLFKIFLPNFLASHLSILLIFWMCFVIIGYVIWLIKSSDDKIRILLTSILVYLMFMLFFRMNVEGESERYLSPIIPLVILTFWQKMEFWKEKTPFRYIRWIVYAFGGVIIFYNLARTFKNIQQWILTPPDLVSLIF